MNSSGPEKKPSKISRRKSQPLRIITAAILSLGLAGCDPIINFFTPSPGTEVPLTSPTSFPTLSPAFSPTSTETPTLSETPLPTQTFTPTETPTPTPEPKPAEIILTELGPGVVMETVVKRTSDCLVSPWQKYSDGSEPVEYKQLRDSLHEKGIVYDGFMTTGGNYPDPTCFIAVKGTLKPFDFNYWYLTADGELDTFHIIVKSP